VPKKCEYVYESDNSYRDTVRNQNVSAEDSSRSLFVHRGLLGEDRHFQYLSQLYPGVARITTEPTKAKHTPRIEDLFNNSTTTTSTSSSTIDDLFSSLQPSETTSELAGSLEDILQSVRSQGKAAASPSSSRDQFSDLFSSLESMDSTQDSEPKEPEVESLFGNDEDEREGTSPELETENIASNESVTMDPDNDYDVDLYGDLGLESNDFEETASEDENAMEVDSVAKPPEDHGSFSTTLRSEANRVDDSPALQDENLEAQMMRYMQQQDSILKPKPVIPYPYQVCVIVLTRAVCPTDDIDYLCSEFKPGQI
jgi:hypothetical protein